MNNPDYYSEYKRLGGTADKDTFETHIQRFFNLTFDAYVFGEGSRRTAWRAWGKHIGDKVEAKRYFDAVDNLTAYS